MINDGHRSISVIDQMGISKWSTEDPSSRGTWREQSVTKGPHLGAELRPHQFTTWLDFTCRFARPILNRTILQRDALEVGDISIQSDLRYSWTMCFQRVVSRSLPKADLW